MTTSEQRCVCGGCEYSGPMQRGGTGTCGGRRATHPTGVDYFHDWQGDSAGCEVHAPQPAACKECRALGVQEDRLPPAPHTHRHDVVVDEVPQPASAPADVLREVEWKGFYGRCPSCGGHKPEDPKYTCLREQSHHGHAPTCRLKAALEAEDSLAARMEQLAGELEAEAEPHLRQSDDVFNRRYTPRNHVKRTVATRIRDAVKGEAG